MTGPVAVARRRARAGLLALSFASVAFLRGTPARADPADECVASAEQSQPLLRDGKLSAARRKLMACSRPECPAVVRNDCTKWLTDLDAMMPTLVVRAVDSAGADVLGVRVFIDGERRDAGSEGKEFDVDPGTHTLRLERDGVAPVEQTIVVRESERHRIVSVSLGAPLAPAGPSAVAPQTAAPPEAPAGSGRSVVVPVVLLAAGGVGLGVASALWASGLGDRSSMESSCAQAHMCSQAAIDSARGKLVAGDVVAGVGIVAAATGLGILVFGGGGAESRPAAAVDVRPVTGGAQLSLQGRF